MVDSRRKLREKLMSFLQGTVERLIGFNNDDYN